MRLRSGSNSFVVGTAGFGGDVFEAGLRGFFAAFPLLRLALAVLVTFFRATFFVTLPFVLFLAINASSSSWCGLLDHVAHRRPLSAIVPRQNRSVPPEYPTPARINAARRS